MAIECDYKVIKSSPSRFILLIQKSNQRQTLDYLLNLKGALWGFLVNKQKSCLHLVKLINMHFECILLPHITFAKPIFIGKIGIHPLKNAPGYLLILLTD